MSNKPELQERLEQEGWEFLTNEGTAKFIDRGMEFNPKIGLYQSKVPVLLPRPLPSDEALIEEYKGRGFKEVRIAQAFTGDGEPAQNMKAVYVKRK